MSEFEPGNDPFVAMSERNRPSGCRIALTLLIVIAMVGVSASGAIWFFFFREEPQPVNPDPIVEVTAVPNEDEDADSEGADDEDASTLDLDMGPTETAVSQPAVNGDVINRIAYINDRGQIVSLEPNGEAERQLTDAQQLFQFPAWSPDGPFHCLSWHRPNRGGAVCLVG